jgi:Sec-independent protein translocase protein TatA
MRRRISGKLKDPRALVVVVGLLLAVAWAAPSLGASVGKVARLALGRANEAVHDANLAINSSDAAKQTANNANATANSANTTANAARSVANTAQTTANTAQATANHALTKANSIVTASYARMDQPCNTSSACNFDHAKGVTGIRQTATAGTYCLTVSGRSPTSSAWTASVDAGDTATTVDAQALPVSGSPDCSALFSEFEVKTQHVLTGASDIAFFVVIP